MGKVELLKQIEERLRQADLPLKATATNLVFGEGNVESRIVFIGEAPGFHEDKLGRPFVGVAGKLLDRLLLKNGLKREEVYITNMVKYRPPENRDPLPGELDSFANYLDQQLEVINPEIIVTLGRFSMGKFLPGAKISQVHGRPERKSGKIILPLYHPAAALRNGSVLAQLEKDFEMVPKLLENPNLVESGSKADSNQIGLF